MLDEFEMDHEKPAYSEAIPPLESSNPLLESIHREFPKLAYTLTHTTWGLKVPLCTQYLGLM